MLKNASGGVAKKMSWLFGPVPSRRYGRSLGIDLVPMKTCCYDCVFCQLGITPQTTCERSDYVPLNEVFQELEAWFSKGGQADMLTLCGSGEPTLHAHFGDVLRWIRDQTSLPSLLMSNGALFADPVVRKDAAVANRVKISMHFWDEASFAAVVRPHASLHFRSVYEAWLRFRQEYEGALDVEFFALPGLNVEPEQLEKIYRLIEPLCPDTVTVNSAARPPAESCVRTVSEETLAHLRAFFAPLAGERHTAMAAAVQPYSEQALLALARRHPLTPAQFARYFGVPEAQILQTLRQFAATDEYAARALLPREK